MYKFVQFPEHFDTAEIKITNSPSVSSTEATPPSVSTSPKPTLNPRKRRIFGKYFETLVINYNEPKKNSHFDEKNNLFLR